jgi:hypothetical protein
MAVKITRPPTVRFVQIRNEWARDRRIGLKEKGLLTYLHSHADGYELSLSQIVRDSTDGKDAVRTGLTRLEEAGYLTQVRERGEGGRWGEVDYVLADPFDAAGHLLPQHQRETRQSDAADRRETRQSGLSAPDNPRRTIRPIEEEGENTTGSPTDSPARHLSPVQTPQQRIAAAAQELTKEHYDASGGLARFPAVLSIVKRALSATDDSGAARWNADAVRGALTLLREAGRPVTLETLRAALTTPAAVRGRGYGAGQPYRNPDPRTHPDAFQGAF